MPDPRPREATSVDQSFHENLEKAGHKVTVVGSPEALTQALARQHYDVIIAYAADVPAINEQIARIAPEPALIPVFQHGKRWPFASNIRWR